MKEIMLREYQINAVNSIEQALKQGRKRIAIEMPVGCGNNVILLKLLEILPEFNKGKNLVVTHTLEAKKYIQQSLLKNNNDSDQTVVETQQKLIKLSEKDTIEYQFVIFYDVVITKSLSQIFYNKDTTIIAFLKDNAIGMQECFTSEDVVFSYSYKQAVDEGYITPAMDPNAFEPAVEAFSKQLLKQFGYTQVDCDKNIQDSGWDLVVKNNDQTLLVECKAYKSQVVSPFAADSMLKSIVLRKTKQNLQQNDLVLLIVLSSIPSFRKKEIYERFGTIIWDIQNLVFYSKQDPDLIKQLSQITYFPIDYIEGQPSEEAETVGLRYVGVEDKIFSEAEKETDEVKELIQQLGECKPGKKYSSEYENICEKILSNLFASYFNRLTNQHKTSDEHFRMDMIGSLKISQKNEESMHPLWKMLVQHYNSHFVVFEFKNYSKEIDQNLIYITEKYLFDAALRNVAIIISRKGFSKSAKFAAEGCLKEHGKLILDITDKDLVQMLEHSDEAADHFLMKLEEFLMGISK